MSGFKTRCGRGVALQYKWLIKDVPSLEDVADVLAAQYANAALAAGAISFRKKDAFEDDLYGFILEKLTCLCSGESVNYLIDSPRLCIEKRLPIFEHRWRYATTLYRTDLPPREKALQFRHYIGEPELYPPLLAGLEMHMKPWPRESDEDVREEQNEFISRSIQLYTNEYIS